MEQEAFSQRYQMELPMFTAWGGHVRHCLVEALTKELGDDGYHEAVKIEPSVRTKMLDSLLNKAFVRKKGKYGNPYEDITDKVGIRFVVLLTRDIARLKAIIEGHPDWEHSLDRDFQSEKDDNPRIFDYQSVHYVVRASRDINIKGISVVTGTPCEVQIRTLLQHAYAEVTHDTLYKGGVVAQPEVHRAIAKSMALMETTDDLLVQAKELLSGPEAMMDNWASQLKHIFQQFGLAAADYQFDAKNMSYLLDALQPILLKVTREDFATFWSQDDHSYLVERVRQKSDTHLIYRQPTVLLLYFLADRYRMLLPKHWPLPPETLSGIYSDLGLSQPWQ